MSNNDRQVQASAPEPPSMLTRYCGNSAADEVRRQIRQRERTDALRYRAAAERLERGDADDAQRWRLRREVRFLRDQLHELYSEIAYLRIELPERISQQLADELPEALDFSLAIREGSRSGTQARRR